MGQALLAYTCALACAVAVTVSPSSSSKAQGSGAGYVHSQIPEGTFCRREMAAIGTTSLAVDEIKSDPGAPYAFKWENANRRHVTFAEQLDYRPQFDPGPVSPSPSGSYIIRDRRFGLQYLQNSATWARIDLIDVATRSLAQQGHAWSPHEGSFANPYADARVLFDQSCNAFTFLQSSRSSLGLSIMLHSADGGLLWKAYPIPGSNGHNVMIAYEAPMASGTLPAPPVILIFDAYQRRPIRAIVPRLTPERTIEWQSSFEVAANGLITLMVAGSETQVQSHGDRVFIAYAANTLHTNDADGRIGVPTFIAEFSRATGERTVGPIFLGVGVNPVDLVQPDFHNLPSLVRDEQGYLHVVIGGHHGPIYYRRSLSPDDVSAWGPLEQPGERRQTPSSRVDMYTYPSLAIVGGKPVIAARWSGHAYHFKLVTIERGDNAWHKQQVVLEPGRPFYGHWYNRLSVDDQQRLFLNVSYFPANLFADEVKALERTYGLRLTDATHVDGSLGCVPSTTRERPMKYCEYKGMRRLNETTLIRLARERPFNLLTTRHLLQ